MTKNHFIIADHIRASCFLISDGVLPGPKQQGYILRRLIRRSLSSSLKLNIDISNQNYFKDLVQAAIKPFEGVYPELENNQTRIFETLVLESSKYQSAVARGRSEWIKELKKIDKIDSDILAKHLSLKTWDLYQTHGVPIEISLDILEDQNIALDSIELERLIETHQKLSQTTSAGQFKSGLGEQNETTTRLHTTTHLLHQVLRDILGNGVEQRGSAITTEKARFDFTTPEKLTVEQLELVEAKVQNLVNLGLIVEKTQMSEIEARKLGAIGLFGEKYGENVTVYTVKNESGDVFSREFCGGPHVQNTKEIGTFTILKQESLGSGLRRLSFTIKM